MDIVIISTLTILGLLLLLAEIFLLPGVTIAAITAFMLFCGAAVYAFYSLGLIAGLITILVIVVISVIGVLIFIRSKMLRKMSLDATISSVSPTKVPSDIKVGDSGVTISRLNPMGTVLINGKEVEAKARESFLDEDVQVVVEQVENTVVIVKKQ